MKIYNQTSQNIPIIKNYNINKTSFKSSFRSVFNDKFVLQYNTNTLFFRDDLNWPDFVNYLDKKFEKAKKVNIINYACSTGEEPFSLAMILDIKLKDKAKKFFPIKAYDIDNKNIEDAKKGLCEINKGEIEFIQKNIGNNYKEYFKELIDKDGNLLMLSTKPNIESKVIFSQSDILKDIHKIPSQNTVLLCRNFIPYLKIEERKDLVKQLSKNLNSSSLVVLGKFEISYGIEKLFEKEGFKHTEQYNVMEKLPFFKALFVKLKYKLKLK